MSLGDIPTKVTASTASITKYLTQYAEAESAQVPNPPQRTKHILVIPAYQENLQDVERVYANLSDLTVVLVVNSHSQADQQTAKLLQDIKTAWQFESGSGRLSWFTSRTSVPVLVVDRLSQPIDENQGVGLARKIGSDIALSLISTGHIEDSFIHSTDADAVLPRDYFDESQSTSDTAFQIYPFEHPCNQDVSAALYQFSLLWYPLGLAYADSIYSFPSIGSTIAFDADAYSKVRGYPRRPAGEDFYLLNKLRKLGPYSYANSQPIELSSRRSERVPFGTGQGIKRIAALSDPNDYVFYHPSVFVGLKQFIHLLKSSHHAENLKQHFQSEISMEFLDSQKFLPVFRRQQQQSEVVFHKFIQDWFDGFRTLKYVHWLRDHKHPSVPYKSVWQSPVIEEACPGTRPEQLAQGFELVWRKLSNRQW